MDGIECSVLENSSQCTVSIKFTKDRAGFLAVREWTVEEALAFADETVRNSGHCCTSACGSWKRFSLRANGARDPSWQAFQIRPY